MSYVIKMTEDSGWYWYVHGTNGKMILQSKFYSNRTHCRNVMKKFAKRFKLITKETK